MHNILLFGANDQLFDAATISRIFQTESGFHDVRINLPCGRLVEADYVEPNDWTIVGLSGDRNRISLSGTTDAALRAALILQRNAGMPLRIIDTDYSFDLNLRDYSSVAELNAAIENAQRTQ